MFEQFGVDLAAGGNPRGDTERQAVDALRGYVFQIYASALAWLQLQADEELFLEVAEDYATTARDALKAVQAKDTIGSGSVTLNTEGVRQAIDALVKLTALNPDRKVFLRYLTTSPIGLERSTKDRIEGAAGLAYWRDVAQRKAPLSPLRERLLGLPLNDETIGFIKGRSDASLIEDLVSRIEWDCGHEGVDEIKAAMEASLVYGGREHDAVAPEDVERVLPVLLHRILNVAVAEAPRRLTVADRTLALKAATEVSVPVAGIRQLMAILGQLGPGLTVAAGGSQTWLCTFDELPPVSNALERAPLAASVQKGLADFNVAVLRAGTGYGKSILAQQIARQASGTWSLADCSEIDARAVAERVGQLLGGVARHRGGGIVLEDLDAWGDKAVERLLGRLAEQARRMGIRLLVTTHRDPTGSALDALGIRADAVHTVPSFTREEIGELVQRAGGIPNVWTRPVQLMSSLGHPQLTQAIINGLASRDWPTSVLEDRIFGETPDLLVGPEMEAARKRLLAAVPEGARSLLYRSSLLIGRARRGLIIALGDVEPKVDRPGEALEILVGPWIDRLDQDAFRISPLVSDAGRQMLPLDEQKRIHEAIVDSLFAEGSLHADAFDTVVLHALQGKVSGALFAVARSLISMPEGAAWRLAENSFGFRYIRTDRPIFPEEPALSNMLRLAQFALLVRKGSSDHLRGCIEALLRETSGSDETGLYVIALFKILMEQRTARLFPDRWLEFVIKFDNECAKDVTWRNAGIKFLDLELNGLTLVGYFLGVQTWALKSVSSLAALFNQLDALDQTRRAALLAAARPLPGGLSTLVNQAWASPPGPNAETSPVLAAEFDRLARVAIRWGERDLACHCLVAKCVMLDEYDEEPEAALRVLDDGEGELGQDIILARARAKVFWRRKDYRSALPILEHVLAEGRMQSSIERVFLLREAAISAGELGLWRRAAGWFEEARTCVDTSGADNVPMSIGLAVDAAVAHWFAEEREIALRMFAECLARLRPLPPETSLKAAYVHRLTRHAVLWIFEETTRSGVRLEGGAPVTVKPGMGSNPEPPAAVAELPLGELDLAWYLLALAELAIGASAGVDQGMASCLAGPPITAQEPSLASARLVSAINSGDVTRFVELLPYFVSTRAYVETHAAAIMSDDLTSPRRGEIAVLPEGEIYSPSWHQPLTYAIDAFGMIAAFNGRRGDLVALVEILANKLPPDHPATERLRRMLAPPAEDPQLIRASADVVAIILAEASTNPVDLVFMSIRLIEAIHGGPFRSTLEAAASEWLARQWTLSVENQSLLYMTPSVTGPAILEAAGTARRDLASMARIVSAALAAVHVRIPDSVKALLDNLSRE